MQRPAEGQAELPAFVRVEPRLAQVIGDVFELEIFVVGADDREDFAEDPFQAEVAALVPRQVGLKKALVAAGLDDGEIGDRIFVVNLAEVSGGFRRDAAHGGHVSALLGTRGWTRESKFSRVVS